MSSVSFGDASAHAPALHDVLRAQEGPPNIASKVNGRHPLEGRISNWEKTQFETRMEMYRRVFGLGEPIKRSMELGIIDATDFKPSFLGSADHMHRDILMNRDTRVDWEDIYRGDFESGTPVADFHTQMEKSMGI